MSVKGLNAAAAWASLLAALCLSGCDDTTARVLPTDPPPRGAVEAPDSFVPARDCSPLGAYSGPRPGTEYIYKRGDGSSSSRKILAVDDDKVVFQYRDLSTAGQHPLPATTTIAGLFVVGGEGSGRRVAYRDDPVGALAGLGVGQSIRIATEETSTLGGSRRTIPLTTTVHYMACGVIQSSERAMPVRVYRVTSGRRVAGPDLRDRIRLSEVTYYLSDETGYPLAFADPGTTSVLQRIVTLPY